MTLRYPLLYLASSLSLLIVGCNKSDSNQITPPVAVGAAVVSTLAGSVPGKLLTELEIKQFLQVRPIW